MSRGDANAMQPFLLLRITLGFIDVLFGLLEFFPDLSPAGMLARRMVARLTSRAVDARQAISMLGIAECAIGLGLLLGVRPRIVFALFIAHMIGTFLPLFVLPELMFKVAPFAPAMHGQDVLENLVMVAAGWSVLSALGKVPSGVQASPT